MAALGPIESAAFIAKHSTYVTLSSDGIQKAADLVEDIFEKESFSFKKWKEHPLHPKVSDNSALDWIFVVDTLNFSFWTESPKYEVEYQGNVYTGYWALCAAINRAIQEGIQMTNATFFSTVSCEELEYIFRSKTEQQIPLLAERKAVLNEAGTILLQKFSGSFSNCLEQCGNSANQLLKLIVENFPSYRDEASYQGQHVSFYKRAQILIGDIWACFEGKTLGNFHDIDNITMFADYRVPQVLNELGLLKYSPQLNDILLKGELLENGSRPEVEIRGCTIWAVDLICKELQKRGRTNMNSILIDYCLWDYRRTHSTSLETIPFHRTRSIYY